MTSDALLFCRMSNERFDLALIDPPYALQAGWNCWRSVSADVVVCESDTPIELQVGSSTFTALLPLRALRSSPWRLRL